MLGRLCGSLKFQIVALAVVAALAAAFGSVTAALAVSQDALRARLLDGERQDRQRTAALLSTKLETLRDTLQGLSQQIPAGRWGDAGALGRLLLGQTALHAQFDTLFVANPQGRILARMAGGRLTPDLPNIGDRAYFRAAMAGDQAVVSEPLHSRINREPIVVLALPVVDGNGAHLGVIGGVLKLQGNSLFSQPLTQAGGPVRDLVITRSGQVLSHSDGQRVLGHARDEPGLAATYARWQADGAPIDTEGQARFSDGHLVSQAGIPLSDWLLVRVLPDTLALAPLAAAQRTARTAALVAGALAALLAGLVAWRAVGPIGQLRDRALRMLDDRREAEAAWPTMRGELGEMSDAFQRLIRLRHEQHLEMQAVLDQADVGLALARDGHFRHVSVRFGELFGLRPEQVVGQPLHLLRGTDEPGLPFVHQGPLDTEQRLCRDDGSVFWARLRARPIGDGQAPEAPQATIWVVADVTAERTQRDRLHWDASHDGLTGLLNRSGFEAQLLKACQTRPASDCLLLADLDRFKAVNDSSGHAAGDALLRGVAQLLRSAVTPGDSVARLGGDEFALLLSGCTPQAAHARAEALRAAVAAYTLDWDGRRHTVGISIGIADLQDRTIDQALRDADAACYAAKRAGRNQVAMA
ncbi:MAG: hypothetical protein RIQ53_152 [Pseudomonadota bacterium]